MIFNAWKESEKKNEAKELFIKWSTFLVSKH